MKEMQLDWNAAWKAAAFRDTDNDIDACIARAEKMRADVCALPPLPESVEETRRLGADSVPVREDTTVPGRDTAAIEPPYGVVPRVVGDGKEAAQ